MNKYIYAVADMDSFVVKYKIVIAKDLKSAQDKIISDYFNECEWDCPDDWKDFKTYAAEEYGIIIGNLKDVETI